MNFSTAALVETVIWDMRSADAPRADNRALIDRLFNGFPPWTTEEATSAQINTNVNFLDGPKLAADARRSYYNAFLKPSTYFTMTLNSGSPRHRSTWGGIVTKEINRILKADLPYFEVIRSQVANTVLHGIGPVHWCDDQHWRPRAVDICELLIPSGTLLSLENLTHFAIFRQYTAPELSSMIERSNVDPGWNKALARKAVKWCLAQGSGQTTNYNSMTPEKIVEQIKEDGGYYATDSVPTVDCWDFYHYSDEDKKCGWRRCMVLDTPAGTEIDGGKPDTNIIGEKGGEWLYYGGDRIYADSVDQILHFQFGDLSPKAPFRYHSVRSLGWLIYAVCNLQNRLRCKINDATFENLLNYFRVSNPEDGERLTKIDLHNFGVVPEGVEFIKQIDRWQVNHNLVAATMSDNRQQMNEAAAQFREGRDTGANKEKTATEIMAEVNSANALVGTMLLLAYTYQKQQYLEISRRFFKENSSDKDVRAFRLRVLKQGVPAGLLDIQHWEVSPEQVLGSGNKMLQVAMADKLMAVRPLLDPDSQRDALRLYIQANSDDAGLAARWVPTKPILVTESVHDAQLMMGPLMMGVRVLPRAGQDAAQMSQSLIGGAAEIVKRILNTTGLPTIQEMAGLTNVLATIEGYLGLLSQDPGQQQLAKQLQQDFKDLAKMVRQWGEQLQKQQQQAAPGGNGEAAKEVAVTQAKLQAITQTAQTKSQILSASAQQKMRQRDAQFRQKQQQADEKHIADLRKTLRETEVDTAIADAEAASSIENTRRKQEAEFAANQEPE